MDAVLKLLLTAAFTIIIETPVMIVGLGPERKSVGVKRIIINSVLVNAITNLTLNLILAVTRGYLTDSERVYFVLAGVLEIAVYIAECAMYHIAFKENVSSRRINLTVLAANVLSLVIGIIILGL